MSPRLAADLASILKHQPGAAAAALERRLRSEPNAPSLESLLELGLRASQRQATDEELLLAVGTLLALHASPADPVRH